MMRYGIPGFRTPRDVLDAEIQRILDLGVATRLKYAHRQRHHHGRDPQAVRRGLPRPRRPGRSGRCPCAGNDGAQLVTATAFLRAFNDGRMRHVGKRVVVVGGGDTSIDVATVARRLGAIDNPKPTDCAENVIAGHTAHDVAEISARQGAEVTLTSVFGVDKMQANKHEIEQATAEGIDDPRRLAPVGVVRGADGRATALRVAQCEAKFVGPKLELKIIEGTEQDIQADLIVSAIGQSVDFTGLEEFDNGKGAIDADKNYQVAGKPGVFAGGDVIRPHLLDHRHRPRRDRRRGHRPLPARRGAGQAPQDRRALLRPAAQAGGKGPALQESHEPIRGTDSNNVAVHNFDNRSDRYVIPHEELFLGHFSYTPRHQAQRHHADQGVRARQLRGAPRSRWPKQQAIAEAKRCMSCGQCFECDNCVVYCPQTAVYRVPRSRSDHRPLRGHRLRQVHRLPHLRRRLPDRLHPDGPGRVTTCGVRAVRGWRAVRPLPCAALCSPSLRQRRGRTPKRVDASHRPTARRQCVEPTDLMRRDHMELLKHQRDKTMHEGIRTHAAQPQRLHDLPCQPEDRQRYRRNGGFCQSCHAYAAVKLDCWDCHRQPKPRPRRPRSAESGHERQNRPSDRRQKFLACGSGAGAGVAPSPPASALFEIARRHAGARAASGQGALGHADRHQHAARAAAPTASAPATRRTASARREAAHRRAVDPQGRAEGPAQPASAQSLPMMCQHCADPPCVDVCPTGASFKRADGIVLVDRHICIGCRYCMMACPYKARSFVHEPLTDQKPDVPRGKGCVESLHAVRAPRRPRRHAGLRRGLRRGRPQGDPVRRPQRSGQRDRAAHRASSATTAGARRPAPRPRRPLPGTLTMARRDATSHPARRDPRGFWALLAARRRWSRWPASPPRTTWRSTATSSPA